MIQFIRFTLTGLAILCAQNLQAFESHIGFIPAVSIRVVNHLVWGEFQHPLFYQYNNQQDSSHYVQETWGAGYQHFQNGTDYYIYFYQNVFYINNLATNHATKLHPINNLGLGLSRNKYSFGINGYVADTLKVSEASVQNRVERIENPLWGIDGHLTIPFQSIPYSIPYRHYMKGYIGVYYHRLEKQLFGMMYAPEIHAVGHFTQEKSILGMAIGIDFSVLSLQASYDNHYGKRIMLKTNAALIPLRLHSVKPSRPIRYVAGYNKRYGSYYETHYEPATINTSLDFRALNNGVFLRGLPIRRHIGVVIPQSTYLASFASLNLRDYQPRNENSRAIRTSISRFNLNRWASNFYATPYHILCHSNILVPSLVRLEKESRIMLQVLALSDSKPYLPPELLIPTAINIVKRDIFKPNTLLDGASTVQFPYLQRVRLSEQNDPYELEKITLSIFNHYRYVHSQKTGKQLDLFKRTVINQLTLTNLL